MGEKPRSPEEFTGVEKDASEKPRIGNPEAQDPTNDMPFRWVVPESGEVKTFKNRAEFRKWNEERKEGN